MIDCPLDQVELPDQCRVFSTDLSERCIYTISVRLCNLLPPNLELSLALSSTATSQSMPPRSAPGRGTGPRGGPPRGRGRGRGAARESTRVDSPSIAGESYIV